MNDNFIYKSLGEKVSLEPEFGLFDKSRRKSSRSKADLFELLLTKELNKHYKLPYKDLENEIKKLISQITVFKDGLIRIEEQKNRVKLLSPFLTKELDKLIIINGKPIVNKDAETVMHNDITFIADETSRYSKLYCKGIFIKE